MNNIPYQLNPLAELIQTWSTDQLNEDRIMVINHLEERGNHPAFIKSGFKKLFQLRLQLLNDEIAARAATQ